MRSGEPRRAGCEGSVSSLGRRSVRLQPSQSCISGVLHSKHTQARELPSQACDGTRYKKNHAGTVWKKQKGRFHSPRPRFSHKSICWKLKGTLGFIKNHQRPAPVWTNADVSTDEESAPRARSLRPDDLAASASTWPRWRPDARLKVVSAEEPRKKTLKI